SIESPLADAEGWEMNGWLVCVSPARRDIPRNLDWTEKGTGDTVTAAIDAAIAAAEVAIL
ncbi:MAG: hypothetical protein ACF8XB_01120, partial [Planctomycetota bacterium JB042]